MSDDLRERVARRVEEILDSESWAQANWQKAGRIADKLLPLIECVQQMAAMYPDEEWHQRANAALAKWTEE